MEEQQQPQRLGPPEGFEEWNAAAAAEAIAVTVTRSPVTDAGLDQPVTVVIAARGELDSLTVPHVEATVREYLVAGPDRVQVAVVDLSGVTFLSSAGLELLMQLDQAAVAGNYELRVVTGGGRAVLRPLQLTGLDQHLRLYATVTDALTGTASA